MKVIESTSTKATCVCNLWLTLHTLPGPLIELRSTPQALLSRGGCRLLTCRFTQLSLTFIHYAKDKATLKHPLCGDELYLCDYPSISPQSLQRYSRCRSGLCISSRPHSTPTCSYISSYIDLTTIQHRHEHCIDVNAVHR